MSLGSRRQFNRALLCLAVLPLSVQAAKKSPPARSALAAVPGRVALHALSAARLWITLGLAVDEAASRAKLARAMADFERSYGDFRALAGRFRQGEAALTIPQYWRALKLSLAAPPRASGARGVLGLSESLFDLMNKSSAAFVQGIGTEGAQHVADVMLASLRVERSLRLALARCWQAAAADAPLTIDEDRRELARWCAQAPALAGDDPALLGALKLVQQQWGFLDAALAANVAPNPTVAQAPKLILAGERMGEVLASALTKLAA